MSDALFMLCSMLLLGCACLAQDDLPRLTAAGCSVPEIQAAVDQLTGPGVVRVPAGRAEAVGTVKVPVGVSLIGAGRDETVLFRGEQTPDTSSAPIIQVSGPGDAFTRISGLGVIGLTAPESKSWDSGISSPSQTAPGFAWITVMSSASGRAVSPSGACAAVSLTTAGSWTTSRSPSTTWVTAWW